MLIVSALYGAHAQEFHSSRHMCCDDVTIKVIWFDLKMCFLPFNFIFNSIQDVFNISKHILMLATDYTFTCEQQFLNKYKI